LTQTDLDELERMLAESGGRSDDLHRAAVESQGLGRFIRSLVGLDRTAATESLEGFLRGRNLTGNQLEFVNLVIEYLTQHGDMDAALLYEPPFTDLAPTGPEQLFLVEDVDLLVAALEHIRQGASAAS
jgi:type I restriction enzyme R subunit